MKQMKTCQNIRREMLRNSKVLHIYDLANNRSILTNTCKATIFILVFQSSSKRPKTEPPVHFWCALCLHNPIRSSSGGCTWTKKGSFYPFWPICYMEQSVKLHLWQLCSHPVTWKFDSIAFKQKTTHVWVKKWSSPSYPLGLQWDKKNNCFLSTVLCKHFATPTGLLFCSK